MTRKYFKADLSNYVVDSELVETMSFLSSTETEILMVSAGIYQLTPFEQTALEADRGDLNAKTINFFQKSQKSKEYDKNCLLNLELTDLCSSPGETTG